MDKILIIIIILIYNFIMIVFKIKESKLKVPLKIEIFNLGSSHGEFAFNYDLLKCISGSNLARSSQTLYYDLKVLNNYFSQIEEGAICFIPLSYFSFSDRKYWLKEDKIRYYRTLNWNLIDVKDKNEAILYKYFPLYISILKRLKKKKKVKEGIERIKGHVKLLKCNNKEVSLNWLETIIKKLRKKNIKIILITTPFKEEYNDFFSKELLEKEFYNNINKIKEKYNLEYYDYSHRYDIFDKEEYFNDSDHLSKDGSRMFMIEISKILKIEGESIL